MAVKGCLNVNIGIDEQGNPVFASVFPQTSYDQIVGLTEFTRTEINNMSAATDAIKGVVTIGDNISVDQGKISVTADNIRTALGYRPAKMGSIENSALAADKLTDGRAIQGIIFDGTSNIHNYAICSSLENDQIKTIELENFNLATGSEVIVTFINGNAVDDVQLQINDEEQTYPLIYNNVAFTNIQTNHTYHFIFDGTSFRLIGEPNTLLGIRGEANVEYKYGLVELNKNDIGLGRVDNTADSIKSVRSSIYAEKDKNGNSIDEYYFTKYDSTLMQVEIDKLNEKYVSTNSTLADLRTEIINNADNINNHDELLTSIQDNSERISLQIEENNRFIDDIHDELNNIHDDLISIHDVAQQGLNTSANVASDLTAVNNDISNVRSSLTLAFTKINDIDNNAETAVKDQLGNVINETYAPLANPVFTGNPRSASTISVDDNSDTLATTKFVKNVINNLLSIDSEVLNQIKDLLENNTILSGLTSLATKQDKSSVLTNFLATADLIETNKLIYATGFGSFSTLDVNNFAETYLSKSNATLVREALGALGKDEKAVSAINADTATNCIGNTTSANRLSVAREFSVTDGVHRGESISFNGTDNVSIPLPSTIKADVVGTSTYATLLKDGKNIQVDLSSNEKQAFNNERDVTPGVTGILSIEHGGTGTNDLNKVVIGLAQRIRSNITEPTDIVYSQFNDEFARIRFNKDNNIGVLEIATADKANEPIIVRQYYGEFDTVHRTLTLLDNDGNTNVPQRLTVGELILPTTRPVELVNGSIWIE